MMRMLTISRTLSVGVLALLLCGLITTGTAQDKPKEQPKISDEEAKALQKINVAPSTSEKTKQVVEFLKKFKKTTQRAKLAEFLSNQIIIEKDPNVKLQTALQYIAIFDQPGEVVLVKPALIDAYAQLGKFDEAYSEGAKYLASQPEDVFVLAQLGFTGALQIQKNGPTWKHAKAAAEHATKAVELMEADKKPPSTDAKYWSDYRNAWLPRIYQANGLIAYFSNERAKAKDNLEKSAGLDPYDVSTVAMLGNIANDEYNELAKRYTAERKSELLDKALAAMDEVIDWYARGVAAAEGNAQLQPMSQQIMEQLKQFYAFRHDGKTEGLQELINKYKKPAK